MRLPKALRNVDERGATVRTFDYGDERVITVDFGPDEDLSVDVVDETVIVTNDDHFEFDLPTEATDVTVNNGVLTITE